MNLFLRGFIAAYLLFFNWTIYALLVVSFLEVFIFLLSSLNIINDTLVLFVSNSAGVMWIKLWRFSNDSRFGILSGWKDVS